MNAERRVLDCIDNWERARAAVAAGDSGPHTIVPGDLLADIEDGAALRRLREATEQCEQGGFFLTYDRLIVGREPYWQVRLPFGRGSFFDTRLAAAADKAREAIEADR